MASCSTNPESRTQDTTAKVNDQTQAVVTTVRVSVQTQAVVTTATAYGQLNPSEKQFIDLFLKHITQFKDPGSVSIINVDYKNSGSLPFVAEIKARNGFGGITSDTYYIYSSGIVEGGSIYSSGSNFNISRINAAIKEYVEKQGW